MRNITDIIETYLKEIIEAEKSGVIEIKRSEVAEMFQCVPSQINYVIKTRFTAERGYGVESKRGGGGYIRIYRIRANSRKDLIEHVLSGLEQSASRNMAEDVIHRLTEEGVVSTREARLMLAAVDRSAIQAERDEIRIRILRAMLRTLKYEQLNENGSSD